MSNREIIEWLRKRAETMPMPGARKMYEAAAKAIEAQKHMISRQAVLDALNNIEIPRNASWYQYYQQALTAVDKLPPAPTTEVATDINVATKDSTNLAEVGTDCISRQAAIDALCAVCGKACDKSKFVYNAPQDEQVILCPEHYCLCTLPSAQPERVWHPVEKPPAHHKDVIVRGVEAIGNVTVHKVMQWDVDTWRPTNYAPSIMWTEWSEI